MAIHLGCVLPRTSSNQPGPRCGNAPYAAPIRSCVRWGLPCRPCYQVRGALLPHRFALTCDPERSIGGLFSVALSVGSPRPGVTRHRVSVKPGLSSPILRQARPSDPLASPPSGKSHGFARNYGVGALAAVFFIRNSQCSRAANSRSLRPRRAGSTKASGWK